MTTEVVSTERVLTAQDRCDACSAAAQVVATFLNGELMFCGHHAKQNHKSLLEKSASIYDPNNYLNTL